MTRRARGGQQSERTDDETFSFHPGAGFRHKRCACAGAGVQGRRHRDRKPWARATPKGAEVGGGYLTIHNNGATPDRLTGGTADFATVEVHQMKSKNGVMEMREVEGGLAIPAHGSVALTPGGYHLMFKHLTHPLVKGESVKATLKFEHAGPVEVEFNVMGIGAAGPGGMKGMKGMKT